MAALREISVDWLWGVIVAARRRVLRSRADQLLCTAGAALARPSSDDLEKLGDDTEVAIAGRQMKRLEAAIVA
jgi:hypothetical protein